MPRIAGVNIPEKKQILYSLPYIYGIGLSLARKILKEAKVEPTKKSKDLLPEEIDKIKNIIERSYKIEGEVRREKMLNIKRLKEIKCWRGLRHLKGLPVRGQTTRKNSRTVRGNVKRTVSAGRKKPPPPK